MPPSRQCRRLPVRDQINILLEEYRAMYGLVSFRLSSLERRTPILATALTGFVGGIAVVPTSLQWILLLGTPVVLAWFLRTTINHVRSLEDALRRIEEIEQAVNDTAKDLLLQFQSSHPSRDNATGGRVGSGAAFNVLNIALLLLAALSYLIWAQDVGTQDESTIYTVYTSAAGLWMIAEFRRMRRYRYRKHSSQRDA